MVDIESVIERLQALEEYTNELLSLANLSLEDLQQNTKDRWAVERGLLLAIECILDIGSHIIAEEKLGRPKDYTEVIDILGKRDVIPLDFAKEIREISGFRNLLIHEYLQVDLKKVYESLTKSPNQFNKFRFLIKQYLFPAKI